MHANAASLAGVHAVEGDVESVLGQQPAEPFGPLDKADAIGEGVLDTQFQGLVGTLDAVQVEVPHRRPGERVGLDQTERRAGHLQLAPGAGEDEEARERRLTGAERTGKP